MLTSKLMLVAVGAWFAMSGVSSAQTSASSTKVSPVSTLKNYMGINYQNYTNGPKFEAPTDSSINHYFELQGKLGGWAVSGVGRLDSVRTIGKDEVFTDAGDHYAKVVTPALGSDVTVNGNIRYYFPTSKASQDKGQDFAIQPRVYVVSSAIKNLEFASVLIPRIYGYEKAAADQTVWAASNYFEFLYSIAPFMTIDLGIELGYAKVRGTENMVSNDTPIYPGFTAKFTNNFSVQPYVEIFANRPKYKTSSLGAFVNYAAF